MKKNATMTLSGGPFLSSDLKESKEKEREGEKGIEKSAGRSLRSEKFIRKMASLKPWGEIRDRSHERTSWTFLGGSLQKTKHGPWLKGLARGDRAKKEGLLNSSMRGDFGGLG